MKKHSSKSKRKSHDLNLSAWGPYSKNYIGISHIPSIDEGKRFDISIFPGLYRRGITIPNVMWESGYHPWESSSDLTYYSHRHQLVWKDQIFSDVSYSVLDESEVLFRCHCVNNTEMKQALIFHHIASMNFPPREAYSKENLIPAEIEDSRNCFLVKSLDYTDLCLDEKNPMRNLSPDGIIWGEVRDHGFTDGAGLGGGFGSDSTDRATYMVPEGWDYSGKVYLRCRIDKNETTGINFSGGISGSSRVTGSGRFELVPIQWKPDQTLTTFDISTSGDASVQIDTVLFCQKGYKGVPHFHSNQPNPKPLLIEGPRENSLILSYEGVDDYYGISWDIEAVVREFEADDIDNIMRHNVHEHNFRHFKGSGNGHFTDIFTRPLYMDPLSELCLSGNICCGTREEVTKKLSAFDPSSQETEELFTKWRNRKVSYPGQSKYSFSMERMAATVLTNVVYPVRVQGSWARHHTPGRWWDSLYTWDSGFIGLGFTTMDLTRAMENLNAYTTLPGNPEAAFIHHGSPVPTQFYLYQEIYNKSNSLDFLKEYYPQLLQYHRFMAGRLGSSTIGSLSSDLLKTWDYFYSSSGMDDYPAQVELHRSKLEETTTPVITTAMSIRTAKILKRAAILLGEPVEELITDIDRFSRALQTHSWDKESGYYSYVIHDERGDADKILKDKNGLNFNCGFDGIYPIVADICSPEQRSKILEKMFSTDHLWTDCGLTAVDKSAPYYRDDGYWNGTVWMSHQWEFWKSMLDMGKPDEAFLIASTGLDLWKKEVEDTYMCFEHFITASGKGAGWHHFGGLSSPVLNWYASYYQAGNITSGHNTWIIAKDFTGDGKSMKSILACDQSGDHDWCVIVTLDKSVKEISSLWKGKPVKGHLRGPGIVEILLPADDGGEYELEIRGV